ncbi:MAG: DUF2726 domain-containing protein [Thiohalocapsa sp.]|uniref:DUF2726 domain-containing protein n=1 Tax=Thiohalocapsa sp. TaxID=2497641 RepID=UPI0025F8D9A4|nr:DUF2726 domain-containing protein [Thiohalocapsa sp.]
MDHEWLQSARSATRLAEHGADGLWPAVLAGAGLLLALAAVGCLLASPRYVRQQSLFTQAEQKFRATLEKAVDGRCAVYAKVRMCDLITPAGTAGRRGWWRAFRRISSKHVDFVLAEPDGGLLLAIELDDASHERADRRARDRMVDRAFAQAGLPLLRVPMRRLRDVRWLRREAERRAPGLSCGA